MIERMPNNAPTMLAAVTMNKALWTVQVLWGIFFSVTGFGKILCYDPALWYQALQQVPWFSAVPQDLFILYLFTV